MRRIALWTVAIGFVCLGGCVASGHRTFKVEVLGQKIEVEDNVQLNDEGKTEYKASFDPQAWTWLWAWLDKPEEVPKDEPTD